MNETIDFTEKGDVQRTGITPKEWITDKSRKINMWLDDKSKFYSKIAGYEVTRRIVLRVNMVTVCLLVAAIAVEQSPIVAIMAAISAGYVVRRLNKR